MLYNIILALDFEGAYIYIVWKIFAFRNNEHSSCMKSTRLERDFSRVTMRFIPFRENDGNEFKSSSCACLLAAVYLCSRSLTFALFLPSLYSPAFV